MIQTISYLLDNPEERKRSGERAIQYVKRHYDKDIIKGKLSELLLSDN
jgi:glycosyltransferase involved in cell wall biosynthesis